MNPGDDPERDDGLPPVDIEIPDDARELDRDVLAYRRELRARRRRARLRRLATPVTGHGAIIPLLATCMALALFAGVLLSVVTAVPASAPSSPAAPSPTARHGESTTGTEDRPLPGGTVLLAGKTVSLHRLGTSVLALIPDRCTCTAALRTLADVARRADVRVFVVGTDGAVAEADRLARSVGAVALDDPAGRLDRAYRPVGLTAVLVRGAVTVAVRRNVTSRSRLQDEVARLTGGRAG